MALYDGLYAIYRLCIAWYTNMS